MSRAMTHVSVLISVMVLLAFTAGCTAMAMQKERELAASGFQVKLADTPEKESHLKTLKQRELFPTTMNGLVVYVYADAKGCNCLYVGSESDYQRYQQMVITNRQVEEQRETAEDLDDASMQWGMWGAWYRPIY
jgi:hypothetical protein